MLTFTVNFLFDSFVYILHTKIVGTSVHIRHQHWINYSEFSIFASPSRRLRSVRVRHIESFVLVAASCIININSLVEIVCMCVCAVYTEPKPTNATTVTIRHWCNLLIGYGYRSCAESKRRMDEYQTKKYGTKAQAQRNWTNCFGNNFDSRKIGATQVTHDIRTHAADTPSHRDSLSI